MTIEKEKINDFIKNIRTENAKGALEDLKEIVSLKQEQRKQQIIQNLEDNNDK